LGINDGSDLLKRYRFGFNHFLDCSDKTSEEIARIMRGLEIDVAIDLSGYTSGSRLDILSYKPAPIQASYLGFPGTLSLPYIDYLVADSITAPEAFDAFYSEKVLRLPSCYLPRDCDVPISKASSTRESHGLPKDGPVLCSFNHAFKITPDIFNVWLNLLAETPGAVLWLAESNREVENSLKNYARTQGVDPNRLIFAKRVPSISDHLERYRHADLFLDTFPYNGHTTVSDALFAGVPVVTLMGRSFASRVAGSLLNDLNLANWTTQTLVDYKQLAKQLLAISPQAKEFLASQRVNANWPFQAEVLARNFSSLGFH
jgi:protein O-GlcNAc transferase